MQAAFLFFAVLVAGTVFGWLARLILPGRQPLSWAETTIVGIVGSGLGALIGNWIGVDRDLLEFGLWTVVGSILGSVVVLALVLLIMERLDIRRPKRSSATDMAAGGETDRVEFKQTARWNTHTNQRDEKLEMVISRTVAGFQNADGGTLLIGVDDDGQPTGLENDLSLGKVADHDRFQLWLIDHLQRTLGKTAATRVTVDFEPIDRTDICRVEVETSDRPVFVDTPKGPRTADFYVRIGNSTRRLLADELLRYRETHWD
ncbi:MAG: putative DNA binding domain-containing protein [Actinomycetota bacterium]|nr:putative DNA binding domain-containing protein [Actinomycetota bacterium]